MGSTVRTIEGAQMRRGPDLQSEKLEEIPAGRLCLVLERGAGRRLLVRDVETGERGWISSATKAGARLIVLAPQERRPLREDSRIRASLRDGGAETSAAASGGQGSALASHAAGSSEQPSSELGAASSVQGAPLHRADSRDGQTETSAEASEGQRGALGTHAAGSSEQPSIQLGAPSSVQGAPLHGADSSGHGAAASSGSGAAAPGGPDAASADEADVLSPSSGHDVASTGHGAAVSGHGADVSGLGGIVSGLGGAAGGHKIPASEPVASPGAGVGPLAECDEV